MLAVAHIPSVDVLELFFFYPVLWFFCCFLCLSSSFSLISHSLVFQLVFLFCSGRRRSLLSVKKNSQLRPVIITAAKRMDQQNGTALRRRLQIRHTGLPQSRALTLTPTAARKQGIFHRCIPEGSTNPNNHVLNVRIKNALKMLYFFSLVE